MGELDGKTDLAADEAQVQGTNHQVSPAEPDDDIVVDEILVEEVSIDGMCGVY